MNVSNLNELSEFITDNLTGSIENESLPERTPSEQVDNFVNPNHFKDVYRDWTNHMSIYAKKACPFKNIHNIWTTDNSSFYNSIKSFFETNQNLKNSLDASMYLPSDLLFKKMAQKLESEEDKTWLKNYNTHFISTLQKFTTEFEKKHTTPKRTRGRQKEEIIPKTITEWMTFCGKQIEGKFLREKDLEIKDLKEINVNLTKELSLCKHDVANCQKEAATRKETFENECKRMNNDYTQELCSNTQKFICIKTDYESQIRDLEAQVDDLGKRCCSYEIRCENYDARIKRMRKEQESSAVSVTTV